MYYAYKYVDYRTLRLFRLKFGHNWAPSLICLRLFLAHATHMKMRAVHLHLQAGHFDLHARAKNSRFCF